MCEQHILRKASLVQREVPRNEAEGLFVFVSGRRGSRLRARSRSRSDNTLCCHSLRSRHFVASTPTELGEHGAINWDLTIRLNINNVGRGQARNPQSSLAFTSGNPTRSRRYKKLVTFRAAGASPRPTLLIFNRIVKSQFISSCSHKHHVYTSF